MAGAETGGEGSQLPAQQLSRTWLVAKICWPIIYVKCMQHFPPDVAVLDEYYVYAQLQPLLLLLLIMADRRRGKEVMGRGREQS